MTKALPDGFGEALRIARACSGMRNPPVLVGGWLPYLLAQAAERRYFGTLDLDLALIWTLSEASDGMQFERILLDLGARPKLPAGSEDRSAVWDLPSASVRGGLMIMDFIAGQPHSGPPAELPVSGTRWMSAVAFDGAALALRDRRDDYALGHVIMGDARGPEAVAAELLDTPLGAVIEEGREAWSNLRARFADAAAVGARNYADLDAQADSRPQTGAERRAVSTSVLQFLGKLGM